MTELLISNFSLGWQNRAGHEFMKAQALFVGKDISQEELGVISCRRLNKENAFFTTLNSGSSPGTSTKFEDLHQVDVEGIGKRLILFRQGQSLWCWNSATNAAREISSTMAQKHVQYALMQPVLSTKSYLFVTDGTVMLADNGTEAVTWGIDPPDGIVTSRISPSTGGLSAGDYKYVYTFYDGVTGSESDPSPVSAELTATTGQAIDLSNIQISANSRVKARKIYRTIAGGGTHYLVATISDNVSTSFTDKIADNNLTLEATMDQGVPRSGNLVLAYKSVLLLSGDPSFPNIVYFSRDFLPDNWPSDQFITIGTADDQILNMIELSGTVYFMQTSGIRRLLGTTAESFTSDETASHVGTAAPWSAVRGPDGIYFLGHDGVYKFDGRSSTRISDVIGKIFSKTASDLHEIVDFDQVFDKAIGASLISKYFLILPMKGTTGATVNKLLEYDAVDNSWFLHNLSLDGIFADTGRGELYGSMVDTGDSTQYMVYDLLGFGSSSVDTPSPEAVTKSFSIVEPGSFDLSSSGVVGRRKGGAAVDWLRKYRFDALGDWTVTFYLDGQEVHEVSFTGLTALDRYKWRDFPDNLKGILFYAKFVANGSPQPSTHTVRALEIR